VALERIPLAEGPNWEQRTRLDGRDYILRFLFNERTSRWTMNIYDQDRDPIYLGIAVVVGCDLIDCVVDTRAPAGEIYAFDLPASGETPTQPRDPYTVDDFGGRVKLFYVNEEDAAIIATL